MTSRTEPLHRYRVWDPDLEPTPPEFEPTPPDVELFMAASPEKAAELYAECDRDGQAENLYDCGHALRVRDDAGEVYEVVVEVDFMPVFGARSGR
jgi:hypothetical protein